MQGNSPILSTRLVSADDAGAVEQAATALTRGELVVFPTDTVYGVGCNYQRPEAIERLYQAKERPKEMAIPLLLSDPQYISQVARALPASYPALAARFWPGGLTIILRRQEHIPDVLCAGGDTIAVRMPDHPVALELVQAAGGIVAATSANRSGNPAPPTAQQALDELDGRVHLVLDGGTCPQGVASSIIDLSVSPPRLLRLGALDRETLREVLPDMVWDEPDIKVSS